MATFTITDCFSFIIDALELIFTVNSRKIRIVSGGDFYLDLFLIKKILCFSVISVCEFVMVIYQIASFKTDFALNPQTGKLPSPRFFKLISML